MGDSMKAFGICALFCLLGFCIACLESVVTGAVCTQDDTGCKSGMGLSSGFINCALCITCLFLFFQALNEKISYNY
jgi:hypothetical protein